MRESTIKLPVTDAAIVAIREILLTWGREHYKNYPWRTPDQVWHSLIAEILLQRTRANNVIPVYRNFVERFPTPESLAEASEDEIRSIVYPLGLHWRVPLLKQLGAQLVQLHGEVPKNLADLLELSGVGTYVAAAWLGFHGSERGVIVDANIVRWICRLCNQQMDGETRRKKWLINLAERITPEGDSKAYNYAVLDFSMEICTIVPKCEQCPLGPDYCLYRRSCC